VHHLLGAFDDIFEMLWVDSIRTSEPSVLLLQVDECVIMAN